MNVLVSGGSGFVGSEIVRQLVAAGHRVRVLSRGFRRLDPAVRSVHGSVLDPGCLPEACAGCDAVVHLVGIISEIGGQTFERVHVDGTRNLLAAARAAGVPRFIHMSALGTRPDAVARYHRTKWAAEESVRASGLDWTLFRPSLVFGPGDHFVGLFARISRWSPVLPVMGDGQALLQPVAVDEVARCFVGALAEPRSIGRTFDLCGSERLSFDAVLDAILAATGRRRMKLHIPLPIARLQAAVMESVFPRVLRRPSPLNRDQLLMLSEDNVGDPVPASQMFRYRPTGFRAGIRPLLA